jgi:MFS superfamily sulfate permease-like transporter
MDLIQWARRRLLEFVAIVVVLIGGVAIGIHAGVIVALLLLVRAFMFLGNLMSWADGERPWWRFFI